MKKTPWLVQRAKFRDVPFEEIVGVDSLLSQDYMGSAEFEFGALPQSLRRITAILDDYEMVNVPEIKTVSGEEMYVYTSSQSKARSLEFAEHLSKEKYGYKEFCDMPDFIEGKKIRNDCWWDIENDFFVCFGEDKAKKLKRALVKLKERWDNQ